MIINKKEAEAFTQRIAYADGANDFKNGIRKNASDYWAMYAEDYYNGYNAARCMYKEEKQE
tara:strand:- start:7999 stop:8181 length:183 start_codon:yes stop_codon:yes gene_type:complete